MNQVNGPLDNPESARCVPVQPSEAFFANQREVLTCITEIGSSLRLHMDTRLIAKRMAEAACKALRFRHSALYLSDGKRFFRAWAVGGGVGAEEEAYLCRHPLPDSVIAQLVRLGHRISQSYFIPADSLAWRDEYLASFFVVINDDPVSLSSHADQHLLPGPTWQPANMVSLPPVSDDVSLSWQPMDMIIVPLVSDDGSMLGMLTPDAPLDGLRPTVETMAVLELFANQAAVVIEGAHLYEQARQSREERAALIEIGRVLSAPDAQRDLQTVYQTMYEQVRRVMPADAFLWPVTAAQPRNW